MDDEQLEAEVVKFFVESAASDSFNGLPARALVSLYSNETELRNSLVRLVKGERIDAEFASYNINPHIKRFPSLQIEEQITRLESEEINGICLYPSRNSILKNADVALYSDRPFSKELLLGNAQLLPVAFEMSVLERYQNDPRFKLQFFDYMGSMSITDEFYNASSLQERDKVYIQTFGLGFDDLGHPVVIAYYRYLANLTAEHQQYWNSFRSNLPFKICPQYYESSIQGKFWENRSVRYPIFEELRLINALAMAIWKKNLFRQIPENTANIDLTNFLRPTSENFMKFIHTLDKLLSENIDVAFFVGLIDLQNEIRRADGNIEVTKKGTLALLEEWLLKTIKWGSAEDVKQVIVGPLRKVRRLRQTPAHKFTSDEFSVDFYKQRKDILWAIVNSLSNIRGTFAKHPLAEEVKVPEWLDKERIDVF